jgi:Chaperone of endosialidase
MQNLTHIIKTVLLPARTRCLIFSTAAFVCFALLPLAQAVSPAPDGGYPGGNTAEGTNALNSLTSGLYNTANGLSALASDQTGGFNTACGVQALYSNNGSYNTAIGGNALYRNQSGLYNTATGAQALFNNTGSFNTAVGVNALYSNQTGTYNTATGFEALFHNTTGAFNTALGDLTLFSNMSGGNNVAVGDSALLNNTTASGNVAVGVSALRNSNGFGNTAVGQNACANDGTGINNTGIGFQALGINTGNDNSALGVLAGAGITTGTGNVAIGRSALLNAAGSNNIAIGTNALSNTTADTNNVICIGANLPGSFFNDRTYIANIYASFASGRQVFIDSDGQLGTAASTRRVKDDIKPMDKASEVLLSLKPVTFHYKKEIDRTGTAQFGLVAEEVSEVSPDLVTRDREGKPETVRYEAVNAMLLNEFLKEHRHVQEQEATIADLKSRVGQQEKVYQAKFTQQQKQIEALSAAVQKVNDRIELAKPATRLAAGGLSNE